MRLINTRTLELENFTDTKIPQYVILSHTWGDGEVSLQDMQNGKAIEQKFGYMKIKYTCAQARRDRLQYAWCDTCCIDKTSSAELQEAINSMFRWYADADVCYVFLSDVLGGCPYLISSGSYWLTNASVLATEEEAEEFEFWYNAFAASAWFTRGWTLQ